MLKLSHISNIKIYSDEWYQARLGKFTSSRIHSIIPGAGLSSGALTYIYHKVGEEITGQSTADDDFIEDENTVWGNQYEPMAINKFGNIMKLDFLVTQKMISDPNSRFSSTPDGIIVHNRSLNQEEDNVSPLEVKCPRKYHKFIPLKLCKTPSDLLSFNPIYYWQLIDQMDNCDSALGYFFGYHPLFPEGSNYCLIEFKKMELWDSFKLLRSKKKLALEKFEALRFEMIGV